MILLIFDVDGTLTDTSPADRLCYSNAFSRFFDIDISDLEFMDHDMVTDNGLVMQVMNQYKDVKEPEWTDFLKAKSGYMIELIDAYNSQPEMFKPIKGGVEMWERLKESSKIHTALATGCWESSAYFKLQKAGYDISGVPFSNNDAALTRSGILHNAIDQSKLFYQHNRYEKIIYVADGVWDFHVCKAAEIPLIGIDYKGSGKLKALGCKHVMQDFNNTSLLEEFIHDI